MTDLEVLAAGGDPRAARSGVTRLAHAVPAAGLAPFFENACRVFLDAGEDELAGHFFAQARRVDKKHPGLVDLDRLQKVFLEFGPTGVVAPPLLREYSRRLTAELPPGEAYTRYHEVIGAALDAGHVPYPRIFQDLRTLARKARLGLDAEGEILAEQLLRGGGLAGAPHDTWVAAAPFLANVARPDPALLDLLIGSEPTAGQESRRIWLGALAWAEAGRRLPAEWFTTTGRASPEKPLLRLAAQAADRLGPVPARDPDTDLTLSASWPAPAVAEITDPADALARTLRAGLPAELVFPPLAGSLLRYATTHAMIVQHGNLLTVVNRGLALVFSPDREVLSFDVPDVVRQTADELLIWYDGTALRTTTPAPARQALIFEGLLGKYEPALTFDPAVRADRPRAPMTAEITFPGAAAPTRVEYARGRLELRDPAGTATVSVPFGPLQPLQEGVPPVLPPGWWPHLRPVDPAGSAALRTADRALAEELIEAALHGPRTVTERLRSRLPSITAPELLQGVVAAAQAAAERLKDNVRLGLGRPASLPPVLATRPGPSLGRNLGTLTGLRLLAGILADGAEALEPWGPRESYPIRVAELSAGLPDLPHEFGRLGARALRLAHPWTPGPERDSALARLMSWAKTPPGDGSGRWRLFTLHSVSTHTGLIKPQGELWRTPSGALIMLDYQDRPHRSTHVIEYSPDGAFGPVDVPGWEPTGDPRPQGWGGAERVVRLAQLLADRGPAPADPATAHALADRTGLPLADAATVCFGPFTTDMPADIAALLRGAEASHTALTELLMPDDPADLWTTGPSIARAAAHWRTRT